MTSLSLSKLACGSLLALLAGTAHAQLSYQVGLDTICGAERAPFMPFAWDCERIRPKTRKRDLGRVWIERDEFEVRRFESVKVSFERRK